MGRESVSAGSTLQPDCRERSEPAGGTHVEEVQIPHCPVVHHHLTHQGHLQVPMGTGVSIQRPVMLALHLAEDRAVRHGKASPQAALLLRGTHRQPGMEAC